MLVIARGESRPLQITLASFVKWVVIIHHLHRHVDGQFDFHSKLQGKTRMVVQGAGDPVPANKVLLYGAFAHSKAPNLNPPLHLLFSEIFNQVY